LAVIVAVLGFNVSSLRKEILSIRESAAFYEKEAMACRGELTRVNRVCDEKERFLNEIEQSITELESKAQLETLERYIPGKTWSEIGPIINKLKVFQETRESNNLSKSGEGRKDG
jgi:hypothetical protein